MSFIQEQVILAEHCRFRVGGPADYFAVASGVDEIESALAFARDRGIPYFIYGGGSNLFFDDAGFRGLVLRLQGGSYKILSSGRSVLVSAGFDLPLLVRQVAEHDLGGIEFLGNIPGTVGGAVVGNAGCYGRAIVDVLANVEVYNTASLQVERMQPGEIGFSYRHSRFKEDQQRIVLNAVLNLKLRPGSEVLAEVNTELLSRLRKHPHEAWCAGSFFKNPSRERPAWRVITEAGMAHAREGGAALSKMHANFLVNTGGATCADIISLVRKVQHAVRAQLGLELIPEVRYVGPSGIVDL
jgi:UDP-N-acetylmuramate dehydrogenase